LASHNVLELSEVDFESIVLRASGPVLVDFTGNWCPPCRALTPILERVARKMEGQVCVFSIDADASPQLASQFKIRGLPTLIVFANGREVARRLGLTSEEGIRQLIDAAVTPALTG
jgi:thioredoxin 1